MIQAFISSRRLSKYLSSSECELGMEKKGYPSGNPENMAVIICDACSTWSSSDEKDLSLILDNVTLQIPKGYLVAVIGEVRFVATNKFTFYF